MYPLIELGPLRLSSGGLLLLLAVFAGSWLAGRMAMRRGGAVLAEQLDRCFYPVIIGAAVGGRLWYGLFNLDLFGRQPGQFLALSIGNFAWPGGLIGGTLIGWLWCRWRGLPAVAIAECIALALPFAEALADLGLLLSGEAFGLPTGLPWGISMFGVVRHPTQLYFALAALITGVVLWRLARYLTAPGSIVAAYAILHGCTRLLIEAWRADSLLLPGGIRAAQVFGLLLVLAAILWARAGQGPARRPAPVDGGRGGPCPAATEAGPNG